MLKPRAENSITLQIHFFLADVIYEICTTAISKLQNYSGNFWHNQDTIFSNSPEYNSAQATSYMSKQLVTCTYRV